MIVIVSGYRRSGTSCMMEAIHNGLGHDKPEWKLFYQESKDGLNRLKDGYAPNPGKLHEVGRQHYIRARFLRELPDRAIIKIFYDGIVNIPRGEYIVLWMERDAQEINDSVARSDAHLRATGVKENAPSPYTFDVYRPYNQVDMDHVLGIMEMRRDVDLVRVNFRDLIEDPEGVFTEIGRRLPVDVDAASKVINPRYYRCRNDDSESRGNVTTPEDSDSASQIRVRTAL